MNSFYKIIFLFLINVTNIYALIYEIGADFNYDRMVYGSNRQNSTVSKSYSAGLSTYLFELTALDLNYSITKETTSLNDTYDVGSGVDLTNQLQTSESKVYGVGIKQMLLPRKYRLMPLISVGYAKQFMEYKTDITLQNRTTKATTTGTAGSATTRVDSMFGAFILQYKMTEQFSLKASVKTLFPAGDWNKARDNVKYAFGFSCFF